MDPRSAGGVGRNTPAQKGRDKAQADRNARENAAKASGGKQTPKSNPAVNPGNPNLGNAGPNYSGPQGAGTGVNAANPNNEPGTPRAPKDGGLGGLGWDTKFGPAPMSRKSWADPYSKKVQNTASGVPVDFDSFTNDWTDAFGLGYGSRQPDSLFDSVINGLANFAGIFEKNPMIDPSYGTPGNPVGYGANWGLDPVGIALSLGSTAFPALKPVSGLYSLGTMAYGQPPLGSINLGNQSAELAKQAGLPGTTPSAPASPHGTPSSPVGAAPTPGGAPMPGEHRGGNPVFDPFTPLKAPTMPSAQAPGIPAAPSPVVPTPKPTMPAPTSFTPFPGALPFPGQVNTFKPSWLQ